MALEVAIDHQYSTLTGFAFAFNILMGNGPLALPAAFQQAGWLISIIILFFLCFTSLLTFTFVVEAMSIANAVTCLETECDDVDVRHRSALNLMQDAQSRVHSSGRASSTPSSEETSENVQTNLSLFDITRKFELGQMFGMHFGRIGNILFYLNICIYLYGDLAIYASGVPKSLRNVVCTTAINYTTSGDLDPCWTFSWITRSDVYRIFVACFAAFMLPFLFFHVTKSRWLQLLTAVIRWLAFALMLCLAIDRAVILHMDPQSRGPISEVHSWNPALHDLVLTKNATPFPVPNPPVFRASGIPNLFGVCVYVFMCHHSIPSVITPVRNKRRIMLKLYIPLFLSSLLLNLLLAGTALAAFVDIKDLYTLNFVPDDSSADLFHLPLVVSQIFGYFLSLFPVFALSSAFPILGCTLLENLTVLCHMFTPLRNPSTQRILRLTLPFIVLVPPVCIALGTDNIGFLVGFTGAFAGSGIQYVIPALLVWRSRQRLARLFDNKNSFSTIGTDETVADTQPLYRDDLDPVVRRGRCFTSVWIDFKDSWNFHSPLIASSPHASPFNHFAWVCFLLLWSAFCIVIVLANRIHPL